TSLNDNIDIEHPLQSRSVVSFQRFMQENFPDADFIIGASMYKIYPHTTEPPTPTARDGKSFYYDAINGSMQIKATSIESYIKSRLVIGVEIVPFPKLLKNFCVDLGGISGALTTQPDREVFGKIAAPICYESIYGDFITGFVRNGAQAIFVITNDGWWGDTFGYKQHFSYSRLRAIENRRSIARSANTGISGFINQRGDVMQELGWWKRGTLTAAINLNSELTVYARYGDYIGRLCSYILIISLLYCVAYVYKKKSNLN
ncbi:MAG: apolipoprotein N-acyltransferase, partial [Rikenellaceae bacterium]